MATKWVIFLLAMFLFLSGLSSALASPAPARIVGGIAFNAASSLFKWLWSLKPPAKSVSVASSRSLIKFEGGYNIETLFEGNKLGIEPYAVHATPTGELLILDSTNSNLYKVSTPLSPYSRPRLLVGSAEGYSGHVDGKLRDARMYHPRGIAVDDKGNTYIADVVNMAIRKVSDAGVTTIAGGKQNRRSHVDGPSDEAILSDDFDLLYVSGSCSLLIIDRGYQAIREIQFDYDECSSDKSQHYDGNFQFLGVAVLVAAGFFGYMLALLVQRVRTLFSSHCDPVSRELKNNTIATSYQRLPRPVIPPLIPDEDEPAKPVEGFLSSFVRLVFKTGSSAGEILAAIIFWGIRKKQSNHQRLQHYHHHNHLLQQPRRQHDTWPVQESYIIEDEDEPPFRPENSPTPKGKQADPFMKQDFSGSEQLRQRQMQHHQQQQQQQHIQHRQRQQQLQQQQQQQMEQQQEQIMQRQQREWPQRHASAAPKAKCFEQSGSEASEIVFGAVQEQDGRREAVVIKAVDYSDPSHNHHNVRSRFNYMGYSYGYS